MFLGIYDIDEYVAIPAATHRFSSGAAYQPTALTYSIYEEGGTTGLDEDVDMTPASPFDAITGAYLARRQLTAAAGFERDKTYLVAVKATVDSVAAVELHVFQIRQKQTGDSYARLGAPAGESVSADVAAVKAETATIVADTNELQTDLTNGGRLDLLVDAIKAKTDNLPAVPAAVGSEMTLTAAYDAAKTAASQSSVNSIPTNPLLTNDARLNNLNATIASRLAADNYTAPANDNITAIKAVTDKLDDTLELADGKNRFTEAALAEGPAADVSAVVDDLVDGFLDAQLTGHDIVGSVGAAIAASSASGDPWTTELPGTYAAGTAGNIIGTKTASAEEIREELDTRSSKFSILGRILKF